MRERNIHINYLKAVCIILMVIFHLASIGDKYPYLKQIVYTFHMPVFLILSGYLVNLNKEGKQFLSSLVWIFIPYAIMETGYVLMSTVLPIRESIDSLTLPLLLNKVFIAPLGPYWYLHTLIISYAACYLTHKIPFADKVSFFIASGICFWILSGTLRLISMANAIYFLTGIILSQCRVNFQSVFQPSLVAIFPLMILCRYPENLNRYSLAGMLITYLSISFLLWAYRYIPHRIKHILHFIGRNTLSILLFSPIFTMLSKMLIPLFVYDSSGVSFTCVAVTFVITGCFLIARSMDKWKLSRFFCGRRKLIMN